MVLYKVVQEHSMLFGCNIHILFSFGLFAIFDLTLFDFHRTVLSLINFQLSTADS